MKIYVITEVGVDVYKNWPQLKAAVNMDKDDFIQCGSDYVLKTDLQSYEITKDARLLQRVASDQVFAKSKFEMSDWIGLLTLLFAFLIYIK